MVKTGVVDRKHGLGAENDSKRVKCDRLWLYLGANARNQSWHSKTTRSDERLLKTGVICCKCVVVLKIVRGDSETAGRSREWSKTDGSGCCLTECVLWTENAR